jgi:hypothetical protein
MLQIYLKTNDCDKTADTENITHYVCAKFHNCRNRGCLEN